MTMSRAQTTMDFAVGVSVFLVTVAFAFTFVPGIIAPFAGSGVGDPVTANRLADDLVGDRLAGPGSQYVLSADRVEGFFASGTPLDDRLPVPRFRNVNVTLEAQDGTPAVVNGTTAVAGQATPTDADVTVAWRVVSVNDTRMELVVRVW